MSCGQQSRSLVEHMQDQAWQVVFDYNIWHTIVHKMDLPAHYSEKGEIDMAETQRCLQLPASCVHEQK